MDPHLPLKRKQIQMSEKYRDKKPSRVKDVAWIYAVNCGNYPIDTINSGKYMLFIGTSQIDAIWSLVKNATISGLLGDASKVSTYSQRKRKYSQQHVICVYTYDCHDWIDRQRIEQYLTILGLHNFIYKTNSKTLEKS